MIDGLAEMLPAATVAFECRGRTWRMGELTARDYAEMSAFLIAKRPHPLDAMKEHLKGLDEKFQIMLLNKAFDAMRRAPIVTQWEIGDWLYSPEGTIYATWCALRKFHPDVTMSQVEEQLFRPMSPVVLAKFQERLDQLSGMPTENPSPAAEQATTPTASPSPGVASSA